MPFSSHSSSKSHNTVNNLVTHNFSTGFNEEFFEIFGKNPDEISNTPMKNTPGKIDGNYFARLILNDDIRTWIHVANMNYPLTTELSHAQEVYENILAYFANMDFTALELEAVLKEDGFPEIARYIITKFPKTDILSAHVSTKSTETLDGHKI